MTEQVQLKDWLLHDAPLDSIHLDWESGTCILNVSIFLKPGQRAVACTVRFEGVQEVLVPHRMPWGDSVFINNHRQETDGVFIIEMQSGDELRIQAASVSITTNQ